jgi:hypothetical protein
MTELVWMRRRKGGMRRVEPIEVRALGVLPSGYVVIELERRGRLVREAVHQDSLRAPS